MCDWVLTHRFALILFNDHTVADNFVFLELQSNPKVIEMLIVNGKSLST